MTHRHARIVAVALAASAAIAAPAAAQDLRSPDAADPIVHSAAVNSDLRSPDAADPSVQPAVANSDLRSPDAADPFPGATVDLRSPDAADPYSGIPVTVVERTPVASVHATDPGFDWRAAGVGAGVLLALVVLAIGGSFFARRHRTALS